MCPGTDAVRAGDELAPSVLCSGTRSQYPGLRLGHQRRSRAGRKPSRRRVDQLRGPRYRSAPLSSGGRRVGRQPRTQPAGRRRGGVGASGDEPHRRAARARGATARTAAPIGLTIRVRDQLAGPQARSAQVQLRPLPPSPCSRASQLASKLADPDTSTCVTRPGGGSAEGLSAVTSAGRRREARGTTP